MDRCPSGLRSWFWKPMCYARGGSNPSLSAFVRITGLEPVPFYKDNHLKVARLPFRQIRSFVKTRHPVFLHTLSQSVHKKEAFNARSSSHTRTNCPYLEWEDSNLRNVGIKTRCLTTWRHPIQRKGSLYKGSVFRGWIKNIIITSDGVFTPFDVIAPCGA